MDCSTPGSPVLHYPRVCSSSCLLSWWFYVTISLSAAPFSSCLQSFPASGCFPNESVLHIRWPKYRRFSFSISPSNEIQAWFPLRLTGYKPQTLANSGLLWSPGSAVSTLSLGLRASAWTPLLTMAVPIPVAPSSSVFLWKQPREIFFLIALCDNHSSDSHVHFLLRVKSWATSDGVTLGQALCKVLGPQQVAKYSPSCRECSRDLVFCRCSMGCKENNSGVWPTLKSS